MKKWAVFSVLLIVICSSVSFRSRAATGDPVLINEVLASHTGTDDTEFIELIGLAGFSLDGLSLIVVEGDSFGAGMIDRRIDFGSSDRLGSNGFFLVGNPAGLGVNYGVTPNLSIGNNFLENSSLTVALVQTSSLIGSTVASSEVVLDAVALTDGDPGDTFFFGAPVIGPDGPFFPAGSRRVTDGVDTDTASDWVISDFNLGPENTPTAGDPPPPMVLTIMEIQGSGQFSPFDGAIVETTGVVTLFTANGANFWLQDPAGDGDAATSDGIFVAGGGFPAAGPRPEVGDQIRIIASVQEQQFGNALPLTRLLGVQLIEVQSVGNPLPPAVPVVDLPDESLAAGIDFWEPLEGMLVSVENAAVIAPTNGFGEFALLAEGDFDADSGYFPQTKQILLRQVGPNQVDYNPERILVDDSSLDDPVQVVPGNRIKDLVGVVDYTFGNYKIQPADLRVIRQRLPSLPASKRSGPFGDTAVTTWNVENLFDLIDEPGRPDPIPTVEALETQLNKLAQAIQIELGLPEILVVQEVENTAIVQELGDRVNAVAGTDYQAISFDASDVRGIEVAFLWDAGRVSLLNAFQLTGPDVEAAFGPSSPSAGREPLIGEFEIGGKRITVVGCHFKSKSGDDPLFGVNIPNQRITEVQRKAQARVVRDFVNTLLDADPEAHVIVAGDLNDFEFGEPGEGSDHPLAILEGSGGEVPLTNLVNLEKDAERFSFIFDGNSQVLDHMLISPALMPYFAGVDFLHFNAGLPDFLNDDSSTPLRASDHDPLEGRFHFR